MNNIVIFTNSQSAFQAIAQMQHHKQPIVTDILTTANMLHNQKDIETFIQWFPGYCDIPGNGRADKLEKQGTSKTRHSWQHWVQLLPTPTTSKPDRPYQPTTQSSSDCHISPPEQTTHRWMPTYIASRQKTKQSVSTAPTLMKPLTISYYISHYTTTDCCHLNQQYTSCYMDPPHNCNE